MYPSPRLSIRHPVEAMRIVMMVAGVLLLFVGCVWILQGINVLPGSFMTGQTKWAVIGAITVIIGIVLIVLSRRGAG
jgi:multisubunit Na+/H+ antiporter MnhG subunit